MIKAQIEENNSQTDYKGMRRKSAGKHTPVNFGETVTKLKRTILRLITKV